VQIYLEPLRKKVGADSQLVTAEEIKQLFANVEMIYNFNSEFSKALEDTANKRKSFEIGDIFLRMVCVTFDCFVLDIIIIIIITHNETHNSLLTHFLHK
jgi:hypothetical protein